MDESALHRRLEDIERRQYLILGLLVVPYLIGVASFLLRGVSISAGTLVVLGVGVVFACFLSLSSTPATAPDSRPDGRPVR